MLLLLACRGAVTSELEAELAYLGFDQGVARALDLGLQGFSQASSANIDTQKAQGELSGTMAIDGQVDQGSSDNKGLRLEITLVDYADESELLDLRGRPVELWYDTEEGVPLDFDVQLRDIPDGTLEGTLLGTAWLDGDLGGPAGFDLAFDGAIQAAGSGVERAPGTVHVTGTVTGPSGEAYTVDVTR